MQRSTTGRGVSTTRPPIDGAAVLITGASSGIAAYTGTKHYVDGFPHNVLTSLVGFVTRFLQRRLARATARQLRSEAS